MLNICLGAVMKTIRKDWIFKPAFSHFQCPGEMLGNMLVHIEKLQNELHHVKNKLNYQFPDPNLWANFALESHGKTCHFTF